MDVGILAGPRGDILYGGRIVARVGQWEARAFPGGDWEGSCACEWYAGSDPEAYRLLLGEGVGASLRLLDYNGAAWEGDAIAVPDGEIRVLGDVVLLEARLAGHAALRPA